MLRVVLFAQIALSIVQGPLEGYILLRNHSDVGDRKQVIYYIAGGDERVNVLFFVNLILRHNLIL